MATKLSLLRVIHGTGSTPFVKVGTVGRFIPDDRYLIITIYAI
jgi:hypothetical protein